MRRINIARVCISVQRFKDLKTFSFVLLPNWQQVLVAANRINYSMQVLCFILCLLRERKETRKQSEMTRNMSTWCKWHCSVWSRPCQVIFSGYCTFSCILQWKEPTELHQSLSVSAVGKKWLLQLVVLLRMLLGCCRWLLPCTCCSECCCCWII